jgi:hypothetical protein
MASLRLLSLFLLGSVAFAVGTPDAPASPLRPPVVWLKGEGNFTKAHRAPHSIDRIVVHVTEGAFWGSVRWLKSPRAHASSHFVVSRRGKVVQLVHLSDIAWHAGNWNVNVRSIGIEHEGFTYGPAGFTDAQYRHSAQLTAWIARRSLMPIDRAHIIGHHEVPGPSGGRGGASHHTDPGPRWNWNRYLALVRSYALPGRQKLSVTTWLPSGPLRGVVPWRAPTTGGVRRVEFVVDGRVAWTDRQAPFAFRNGRGLNTTGLRNGTHVFELRAYGDGTRHDITRRYVVVANREFTLTSAGARPWTRVRGTVRLRVRAHGAKADRVVFTVDGRRLGLDRTPPFAFRWNAERARRGKHVLEVVATAADGRVARIRIPLVSGPPATKPKPAPPTPTPPTKPAPPRLEILSQSLLDGQEVSGFVIWRVETAGRTALVEFLIDGALRGTDVAAPYTLGWSTTGEPPGPHRLTARAIGEDGKAVSATVTVTVPAPPTSGGNEGP